MNTHKLIINKSAVEIYPSHTDYIGILSKRISDEELRKISPILKRSFDSGAFGPNETLHNISDIIFNMLLYMFTKSNFLSSEFIAVTLFPCVKYGSLKVDEIISGFGEEVMVLVNGFLNVSNLYNKENNMASENYLKLTLTFAEDIRVIYLNLIFRLILMRQIDTYKISFQKRIVDETATVYIAFAHKLGFSELKNELEDLCFKYNHPDTYYDISKRLTDTEAMRERYIEEFAYPIHQKMKELGISYTLKGRNKSIASIYKKMIDSNISFDQIYDLKAIRIIADVDSDKERDVCWKIYSIVTEIYQPNESRMKDWITNPKPNGYESLHITVMGLQSHWVEVQIRSKRMDEIAEQGMASHWKYKGVRDQEQFDSLLVKLNEALLHKSKSKKELSTALSVDLFNEELFVFTTKGELHKIPYGASVLDFAFMLSPQIGYNCVSGIVNGKVVPIRYKLNNGDRIDLITSPEQTPQKEWIKFVTTDNAINQIWRKLKNELTEDVPTEEHYEISLRITGQNAPENMLDIVRLIDNAADVSLDQINVNTQKTVLVGHLILSSNSMIALEEVIKKLAELKNIEEVKRV
ncbi:HD domain-containing protein [Massilibacteroides sp.]|uniref:HD domain-containing protein n=1 Tax=Massilibacteroides sp. TaxID=2034766 RepID=UPI00262B4C50|nr:HD domain-containing protein [Massilibacteroides sp.]MDD4514065.1 HD domain-containing protein [Massilibacteroides sp.]